MSGDIPTRRLTAALTGNAADLLRYLERRLGHNDAADALAEVMTTAWKRIDSLPADDGEARMWLFGVARNVVANTERSELRRWRLAERLRLALLTAPREHHAADEGDEVRDAIARLSPELAEIIRLIHWDGFTAVEVGQLLGVPASTVRGRYQRAREELKTILVVDRQPQE